MLFDVRAFGVFQEKMKTQGKDILNLHNLKDGYGQHKEVLNACRLLNKFLKADIIKRVIDKYCLIKIIIN